MRGLIGNRGSAVLVSVAVIATEHSTGMILTAMPSYEDIVRLQNRGGVFFCSSGRVDCASAKGVAS